MGIRIARASGSTNLVLRSIRQLPDSVQEYFLPMKELMRNKILNWLVGVLNQTALICGIFIFGLAFSEGHGKERSSIAFNINRDGSEVGRHTVEFYKIGRDLHVDIAIDINIKVLFIPVYSYKHRNAEIWRDGKLLSITTETNDDGEEHWVKGKAEKGLFRVSSSSGDFIAPATIIPTSYWSQKTTAQSILLDTQHGKLLDVTVTQIDDTVLSTPGANIPARHFVITGDLELSLWYSQSGGWVKTAFQVGGAEFSYTLHRKSVKED